MRVVHFWAHCISWFVFHSSSPDWCIAATCRTSKSFPQWRESLWTRRTTTSTPSSSQAAFPSPGRMRCAHVRVTLSYQSGTNLQTSPSSSSFIDDRDGMFQGTEYFRTRGISISRPRLVPGPRQPQTQPAGPDLPQTCKNTFFCDFSTHNHYSGRSTDSTQSEKSPSEGHLWSKLTEAHVILIESKD